MTDIVERPDITCPQTKTPIPLQWFSVNKWSDTLWFVYCPHCRLFHKFQPRRTNSSISSHVAQEAKPNLR